MSNTNSAASSSTAVIPSYRQQVRKVLPAELLKPCYWHLLWIPIHLALIGLMLYLLAEHFSWWAVLPISLTIGHSFTCIGFVAHDVGHGGSVKHPFFRDLITAVGFSPFAIGPYLWRRWHNADHHNNTNIEGVDPDHLFTIEGYKRSKILRALYRIWPFLRNVIIFSSFSYRMTQQSTMQAIRYLRSPNSTWGERAKIIAQWTLPLSAWVTVTLLLGSQVFWWGYLVPLLVANTIAISYIATNHFLNPLADENDVLATSLSVTLPRPLKWLDPMHSYFGAHVGHHLFPQAPAKSMRKIEQKVAELFPDRYHSMPITTALSLLWKTPWVYDEDQETLVDPHRQVRFKTLGRGLQVPWRRPKKNT